MKPSIAHFSSTVPATLAAVIGISLSVFLLPGAGLQGEPTPLLPAIAGATGRIAAGLPVTHRRASEPVRTTALAVRLAATRTAPVVAQPRHTVAKAHPRTIRARTRVVRRPEPAAPAQVVAPVAAPVAPGTTSRWSSTPRAKGKARGHDHASRSTAAPGVRGHGHGKARGRSSEHHHGGPPGQAKKQAPAKAAPAAPPRADQRGNGHKGGKK